METLPYSFHSLTRMGGDFLSPPLNFSSEQPMGISGLTSFMKVCFPLFFLFFKSAVVFPLGYTISLKDNSLWKNSSGLLCSAETRTKSPLFPEIYFDSSKSK